MATASRPPPIDTELEAQVSGLSTSASKLSVRSEQTPTGPGSADELTKGNVSVNRLWDISVLKEDPYQGWNPVRRLVARVIRSHLFDCLMGIIVFANIILVIIETDKNAECRSFEDCDLPIWISLGNLAFLCLYIVEAALRLCVDRVQYFYSPWNLFDLLIIGAGIIGEVMEKIPSAGILRMFRAMRLMRAVRVLRHFHELYVMIKGFASAMITLMWAAVLTLGMVTFWSVIAVTILHPFVKELADRDMLAGCERCSRALSSVYQADLTFFQTIIAGDGWGLLALPLLEEYGGAVFILIPVFFTVELGMMNLVTAVIVENAEQKRLDDLHDIMRCKEADARKAKEELAMLCEGLDEDGSGELSLEELLGGVDGSPAFVDALTKMEVDVDDLKGVFDIMDQDKSGSVSYEEFTEQLYKIKNQDIKTMLMFIKHYVYGLRQQMEQHVTNLQTKVLVKEQEQTKTLHNLVSELRSQGLVTGGEKSLPAGASSHSGSSGQEAINAATRRITALAEKILVDITEVRAMGQRFDHWAAARGVVLSSSSSGPSSDQPTRPFTDWAPKPETTICGC